MKHKLLITNEEVSKAFEVVICTIHGEEEECQIGANMQCLEDDYKLALKKAKELSAKDGETRWVDLRQVLRRTGVFPVNPNAKRIANSIRRAMGE